LRYEIRPYRSGDEEAVLALHNRAFAGHATRSRRHWDWKFRDNPLGATEMVVAMAPDGDGANGQTCVAVYAVVPQRCVLRGEPCIGGLQTDLAVDPALRSGLAGSRLIVATGRAYSEAFLQGKKQLEWGFPEPHLQRVCMAHLQVGVMRDVVFLVREAGPVPAAVEGVVVEPLARFGAEADALWERCKRAYGAAVERDAPYLNWRYADHPDVSYRTLAARDPGGALRGLAVTRSGGCDERLLSVMDWIVPDDDHGAERALLRGLVEAARDHRKDYLGAWFPLFLPQALRWQREHGFFARPTPFQESYRCWVKGLGRRWLDEHWYQTMGDIDFI
jgi:hypothetical protein